MPLSARLGNTLISQSGSNDLFPALVPLWHPAMLADGGVQARTIGVKLNSWVWCQDLCHCSCSTIDAPILVLLGMLMCNVGRWW